jgi:hypothetical protein
MKISIFTIADTEDDGKPTQTAACGVALVVFDKHKPRYRVAGYYLHDSSVVRASLQAARIGILMIKKQYKNIPIALNVNLNSIIEMIENNDPSIMGSENHLGKALIDLYQDYPNLIMGVPDPNDRYIGMAYEAASKARHEQANSDTGTLVLK